MVTRSQHNIFRPIQRLNLHTSLTSPLLLPRSVSAALQCPLWSQAMHSEYRALLTNHTWSLVPATPSQNVVGCRWVFRVKYNSDGSVDRLKARLVAKGFHQRPGLDFSETFSPVVKPATVRLVLGLAVSQGWPLRQLDINNAFLQGTLTDTVFMAQPPGFRHPTYPQHVCLLHKAIYGLRQAPRAWYSELRSFLLAHGFHNSAADTSLFVSLQSSVKLYLLVYVDDLILTGNSAEAVQHFLGLLSARFSLKDLGPLRFFLGVEVLPFSAGLFLCQRQYIADLLRRTHMADARPVPTPMSASSSLLLTDGSPLSDPFEFRATVGSLQYLSLTRPDITFTVNRLSQFLHQPTTTHWSAVKRLLRYLRGTMNYGLPIYRNSDLSLQAFSDSDWAGNRTDFTSTGAYMVFLGSNLVSWSSKKQRTVARSSTEAEYRSVATTAAELIWLCYMLTDLGVFLPQQPVILCDNLGATSLSANPIFHSRMKHVALDFHFVREQVQGGLLRVEAVSSSNQLADILTKALSTMSFQELISKIGLVPPPTILRGHVDMAPLLSTSDDESDTQPA